MRMRSICSTMGTNVHNSRPTTTAGWVKRDFRYRAVVDPHRHRRRRGGAAGRGAAVRVDVAQFIHVGHPPM